ARRWGGTCRTAWLLHHHAAGDVDRLTGHLARVVRREEKRDACDVLGLLEAPHRNTGHPPLLDALLGLAGHRLLPRVFALHHVRVHDSRTDAVDPDVWRNLECHPFAED